MTFFRFAPATFVLALACATPAPAQQDADSSIFADIAPCMRQQDTASRHACYDELESRVRAAQVLPREEAEDEPGQGETADGRDDDAGRAPRGPDEPPLPPVVDAQPATSAALAPPSSGQDEAVGNFGRLTPEQARVRENAEGQQELVDTIVGLQEREPNRYLITLASGQIWNQVNSERSNLRKGMEVRIYPSPLGGSWRMASTSASARGFVQVARVK